MIKTSLFIGTPGMPDVAYVHLFRDDIAANVAHAARLGFDAVELITPDPATLDCDALEGALTANGIALACINTGRMVSELGLTLLHPDERVRQAALDKAQALVGVCSRFRCALNIGLFRGSALEGKPIGYSRDMLVDILQALCDYAAGLGADINLEPTNRFEINWIHTTDEGLDLVWRVDRPNLGLLLDLYHMYLEDASMDESIVKARGYVRHFHFSDSDRWPAGVGHGTIDFPRLMVLLRAIGYSGYLSEGLVPTQDVDACARETAAYLHGLIEATAGLPGA
jgi:sugar phosphate isomerase/epimerase